MNDLRSGGLDDLEAERLFFYNDGELAMCREINGVPRGIPKKLEFYAVVLVTSGSAIININGRPNDVHKDDLFVCTPNNIVDSSIVSFDFKGCFVFFSTEYVQRIVPLAENLWELKVIFENKPVFALDAGKRTTFCRYYDMLYDKARQSSPMRKKIMDALMLAFFYDMFDGLSPIVRKGAPPFTTGEVLFKRFIGLVESSAPKHRPVSYYAECLNVSPKYLSTLCRQAGGERPSDIINRYVLKDIDYLMKHSTKSIKEIAWTLNFSNLSFFGKFLKKHVGMSPKAYRAQILANGASGTGKVSPVTHAAAG